MKALINFKICDNAKECGGVAICPIHAMHFDEEKNTIVIEDTCINCGLCEAECPVGAIMVAKDEEQYKRYQQDIEVDPRTIKDLFVDRYGAASLSEFFVISNKEFKDKIKLNGLTLIEIFNSEVAECLLKSIPIKEITDNIAGEVNYYKLDIAENEFNEHDINQYPVLLIFKDSSYLGKIEGYYSSNEKEEFENKIKEIIKD